MEAWTSNCPRLAVWDDAVTEGLVAVDPPYVRLTPLGAARLQAREAAAPA
jgi:hypothetical protein